MLLPEISPLAKNFLESFTALGSGHISLLFSVVSVLPSYRTVVPKLFKIFYIVVHYSMLLLVALWSRSSFKINVASKQAFIPHP